MKKKIVISSCNECHYKDHKGGFAKISYVPYCKKSNKKLPYEVGASHGMVTASCTGIIPKWCELEDD